MDLPALRRILLALVGTRQEPDLTSLDERDWAVINGLAGQHRLKPLLHAQNGVNPAVPSGLRRHWQETHRMAALKAMLARQELIECAGLLEAAGFSPIALKGAWLAHHAYPAPALRPMRDLDLLVPSAQILESYAALLAAGFSELEPSKKPLPAVVRLYKHMPVLVAPRGSLVELHHRLWEPDGRLDHATPVQDEAALRVRAVSDKDGIRYLSPADTLAHLIIHAVYSHRLDCGPLLLADIDFLLQTAPIDWAQFWARAVNEGWRGGARLVLELVATYRSGANIDFRHDQGKPTPTEVLAAAPDLLLQELDTRRSAALAAAVLSSGPKKLLQRLRERRSAHGEAEVTQAMDHDSGMLGWGGSRIWRSVTELTRSDVRRQSRQLAALSQWLDQ